MIKNVDLATMTVDELWRLYEELGRLLEARLTSEKRELEKRLAAGRSSSRRVLDLTIAGSAGPQVRAATERRMLLTGHGVGAGLTLLATNP